MQPYYVLEIRYPNQGPQTRSLNAERVVIGRDGGDIITNDGQCSATHAEIAFSNGQLLVRDLGSSNGTWKGDQAPPQFEVVAGEEFRCGATLFKVVQVMGAAPAASGGTLMGDPNMLADLQRQRAAGAAATPVPVAAAEPKRGPGLAIAIAAIVLVVAGGGAGAYFWHSSQEQTKAQLAKLESDSAELADAQAEQAAQAKRDEEARQAAQAAAELAAAAKAEAVETTVDEPEVDPTQDEPVVEKDLGELYRTVGEATVVIHTPGSVGSGSIIDPKGLILTNHHVISGGERDGLHVKAKVTLGQYSEELQAFEPAGDALEAVVVKIDTDHDLALLQLVDPPESLPSLTIAEKPPYPGMKVAAVGHAGAGMLWAIKGGEVSSTGKLAGHADLQLDDAKGEQKEVLARVKAQMDKRGRVIQSTAKILPGDSGGPLVSMTSQIVGVNAFGRTDRASGQWLSFHVHLAEVAAFVETIPAHPLDFVPDPWKIADAKATYGDADLDGVQETLIVSTPGREGKFVVFVDLDQSSLSKGHTPPKWAEASDADDPKFDAELIMLSEAGKRHYWYDTDNDGHHDLYMFDGAEGGRIERAYTLAKGAPAKEDNGLIIDDGIDPNPFRSGAMRDRLRHIGPVVFPGRMARKSGSALPNPLGPAHGLKGRDNDGDGNADTYSESTIFHQRFLWDLDQNGGAGSGSALASQLKTKTTDIEVVVIRQGQAVWVWYDTDDDGTLDLMLETQAAGSGVADKATALSGGMRTAVQGHAGRRLFRPDLLPSEAARKRLAEVAATLGDKGAVAGLTAATSFPSIAVSGKASVTIGEAAGSPNSVAKITEASHDLVLVDLDGGAAQGKLDTAAVGKLVRAGKFDAEFALLSMRGARWAFYDSDGRDGMDVVLFAPQGASAPTIGYQVTRDGGVKSIAPGGKLAQWGRFDGKLKTRFEAIAPALFAGQASEG